MSYALGDLSQYQINGKRTILSGITTASATVQTYPAAVSQFFMIGNKHNKTVYLNVSITNGSGSSHDYVTKIRLWVYDELYEKWSECDLIVDETLTVAANTQKVFNFKGEIGPQSWTLTVEEFSGTSGTLKINGFADSRI